MTSGRIGLLLIAALLCLSLAGVVAAQTAPAPTAQDLTGKLDGYISPDAVKMGFVGLLVKSLKDDRVLYSHDADKMFIPASCLKLIVTSATLEKLGPDYKLKTELLTSGKQEGDTLKGDVVLKGYGDSSLDTAGLQEMADALKTAGIKRVTGDLIVDDTYFDRQRFGAGWNWDYEPASYAGPIGALVLNQNCTSVTVKPSSKGDAAQVEFGPPCSYFQVENNVRIASSSGRLRVWRVRGENVIILNGSMGAKDDPASNTLTVDNPTAWIGSVFLQMMKDRGVTVDGKLKPGAAPSGAKVLNTHYSKPLSSIIQTINRHSINVMAECLQKTLGAEAKGSGTAWAGISAEEEFLTKIGAPMDEVNILDGSGLSRCDMVSPKVLVTVLSYMHKSANSKVWIDSLPVAGGDGTLYLSMRKTPAEGNLRAKTGNVGWVQTIAGYVNTKSGEPLVFALMANNYTCSDDVIYHMRTQVGVALAELP